MKNSKPMLFPLDIQLFADPAPTDSKPVTDPVVTDPESTPKTFTQKDIDDAVSKGKSLAKAKYEKQLKTVTGEDVPLVDPTKVVDPAVAQKETQLMQKYAQAEIKVALNASGVDPVKVQRASALIPYNEILSETGDVDTEKLNKAVAALLKEWPELKKISENTPGFKIGADKEKDKDSGLTLQEQIERNMGVKVKK